MRWTEQTAFSSRNTTNEITKVAEDASHLNELVSKFVLKEKDEPKNAAQKENAPASGVDDVFFRLAGHAIAGEHVSRRSVYGVVP